MSWPTPAAGEIASRAAGVFEGAFPPVPGVSDGIDARSPNTIAGAVSRVTELVEKDFGLSLPSI